MRRYEGGNLFFQGQFRHLAEVVWCRRAHIDILEVADTDKLGRFLIRVQSFILLFDLLVTCVFFFVELRGDLAYFEANSATFDQVIVLQSVGGKFEIWQIIVADWDPKSLIRLLFELLFVLLIDELVLENPKIVVHKPHT